MRKVMAVLVLPLLALPAAAMAGVFYNNPQGHQAEPQAAMRHAWLVRVKPGAKAYFYQNVVTPGCPNLTAACKRKGYLLPGDVAVASYTLGAFTVVDFVGPTGTPSDGAIETRLLENVPAPQSGPMPGAQDWIGDWQDSAEQQITVTRSATPGVFSFMGDATWGAGDPERVRNGGVHLGNFAAYVKPTGSWGGFVAEVDAEIGGGEYDHGFHWPALSAQKGLASDWTRVFPKDDAQDCSASFRLLGPYLIAYTPVDACGGMNVTFTGVYRKLAPRAR